MAAVFHLVSWTINSVDYHLGLLAAYSSVVLTAHRNKMTVNYTHRKQRTFISPEFQPCIGTALRRTKGLTENYGHENDGPNLRDIKLQNLTTLNTLALEIHAVTLKWHCFYAFVCVIFILRMHFVVVQKGKNISYCNRIASMKNCFLLTLF